MGTEMRRGMGIYEKVAKGKRRAHLNKLKLGFYGNEKRLGENEFRIHLCNAKSCPTAPAPKKNAL